MPVPAPDRASTRARLCCDMNFDQVVNCGPDADHLGVHLFIPATCLSQDLSKRERQWHRHQHLLQSQQTFVHPKRRQSHSQPRHDLYSGLA